MFLRFFHNNQRWILYVFIDLQNVFIGQFFAYHLRNLDLILMNKYKSYIISLDKNVAMHD